MSSLYSLSHIPCSPAFSLPCRVLLLLHTVSSSSFLPPKVSTGYCAELFGAFCAIEYLGLKRVHLVTEPTETKD